MRKPLRMMKEVADDVDLSIGSHLYSIDKSPDG
jgi:hypothetical protein